MGRVSGVFEEPRRDIVIGCEHVSQICIVDSPGNVLVEVQPDFGSLTFSYHFERVFYLCQFRCFLIACVDP